MFKNFSSKINKNIKTILYKNTLSKFRFSRKINVANEKKPDNEELSVYVDETGNKLDYIKVNRGLYPYMPLDDHPLIPGYARMIAISRQISEKLKEVNAEKTKIVISVLKNPEKVEGVQTTM